MNVSIREFCENDVRLKVDWINNPENNRFLHYDLPLEYEKTLNWFHNKTKNRYDATIICDGQPVGLIGLLGIANEKAEYYITIGEPDYKGKGVAVEASAQLMEYAEKVLGLNTIETYTEVENTDAQRLFEKLGFQKQGIEKNSAVNRGKSVDRFYYTYSFNK